MKKPIRLIALILSILTLLPATCSYNGYCADMDNLISKCLGGPRVCLTIPSTSSETTNGSSMPSIEMTKSVYL